MQKEVPYDFDLSEKLTDLDIEIANNPNFNRVTLNVLSFPRCSVEAAQAFVDLKLAVSIANFA
jgi:hypothetical protein